MQADTDDDGFDDGREYEFKTDARANDTDGDGVDDADEVTYGGDPTMYDARGPRITVPSSTYYIPEWSLDTTYELVYVARDPAGVQRGRVIYDGDTPCDDQCDVAFGGDRRASQYVEFTTGALDSALDSLTGAAVSVVTTDELGNERRVLAVKRSNFYSEIAGSLDGSDDSMSSEYAASLLAIISGLSSSLGRTLDTVKQLIETLIHNPSALIPDIERIIELLRSENLMERLIDGFLSQFQRKMEINNPYEEGENLYELFRRGWYEGYAVGFVMKLVLGYGIGKAIRATDTYRKVAGAFAATRIGQALATIVRPYELAKARLISKILTSTRRVDADALENAETVGDVIDRWRVARNLDVDVDADELGEMMDDLSPSAKRTLRGLDESEQRKVLNVWRNRDRDDDSRIADSLLRLDEDDRQWYLEMFENCRTPRVSPRGAAPTTRACREEEEEFVEELGGPDQYERFRELTDYDQVTSDRLDRFMERTGGDGGALVRDLDDEQAARMLGFSGDNPGIEKYDNYRGTLVERYDGTNVDEIRQVIDGVESFGDSRTYVVDWVAEERYSSYSLLARAPDDALDWVRRSERTETAFDAWDDVTRDTDPEDIDVETLENRFDEIKDGRDYDELEFERNEEVEGAPLDLYRSTKGDLDPERQDVLDDLESDVGEGATKRLVNDLEDRDTDGDGRSDLDEFLDIDDMDGIDGRKTQKALAEAYKQDAIDPETVGRVSNSLKALESGGVDGWQDVVENDIVKHFENLRSNELAKRRSARNNIRGGIYEVESDNRDIGPVNLDEVNAEPPDGMTLLDQLDENVDQDGDLTADDIEIDIDGISVKSVSDDGELVVEARVYDGDAGEFVTREYEVDMNYEFDAITRNGDIAEMKGGGIEKEQLVKKVVRTELYQSYVGDDGSWTLYLNDRSNPGVSDAVLRTARQFGAVTESNHLSDYTADPRIVLSVGTTSERSAPWATTSGGGVALAAT
jgi:hypothetical protein